MIVANYDSRSIDAIFDLLFFYKLTGHTVVKLNLSNVRSGDCCLTDLLHDFPAIIALGLGIGIDNQVMERKGLTFYSSPFIKHIVLSFSPTGSPTIPLPKSLDELVLEFPFKVDGKMVGDYLRKIIVKECKPVLRMLQLQNVSRWETFDLPETVSNVICFRSQPLPLAFANRLDELGFIKTEEEQEFIFAKR